jgi:hypothetical protein
MGVISRRYSVTRACAVIGHIQLTPAITDMLQRIIFQKSVFFSGTSPRTILDVFSVTDQGIVVSAIRWRGNACGDYAPSHESTNNN